MSSLNWIRLSGLAAMLGGMLWAVGWTYDASLPLPPPGGVGRGGAIDTNITNMVALTLIMAGLTGAYFRQAERMGLIGKAGLALPWIGLTLMGSARLGQALDIENAFVMVLTGLVTMTAGFALFGFATLRAKLLPRAAAALLMVSLVLLTQADAEDRSAILAAPLGLAWVWLGYSVWRGTSGQGDLIGRETDA